ncbi:hypothetical protein D1872_281420 [compost metagenome]
MAVFYLLPGSAQSEYSCSPEHIRQHRSKEAFEYLRRRLVPLALIVREYCNDLKLGYDMHELSSVSTGVIVPKDMICRSIRMLT